MVEEKAIGQFIIEHPKIGRRRLAKEFNLIQSRAQYLIRKYRGKKTMKSNSLHNTISVQSIIDKYDIPKKIREKLPELSGFLIADRDFRADLGVDTTRWARARELDEFAKYKITLHGVLHWGMPEDIEEVTKKLDVL